MGSYTYTIYTGVSGTTKNVITFTTSDTLSSYMFDDVGSNGFYPVNNAGHVYKGYQITGVSGTFDGKQIDGLLSSSNGSDHPATAYAGNPSQGNVGNPSGMYDNVLWTSATRGHDGVDYYGLDNLGVAFSAEGTDYRLFGVYRGAKAERPTHYQVDGQGYYSANLEDPSPSLDGSGPTPCFTNGTAIRIIRGEAEVDVPVEELRVGDHAVITSGRHRPIRWIGRRTVDCRRYTKQADVLPVRIRAQSLGENRPARDLLVSPGHSIALDVVGEVLIPAGALINGATVIQEDVRRVTYLHVELDGHDLIFAEGQPVESYLDFGNRVFFADNSVVAIESPPDRVDPTSWTYADFCRPFHPTGPLVTAVRAQMRRRAEALGWRLVETGWTDVHLEVDGIAVRPKTRGLTACFVLPAGASEIFLVCPTSVPHDVGDLSDTRSLGLCLAGLTLDDGLGQPRRIALDELSVDLGFHEMAPGHRWTTGRAHIPAVYLEDLEGDVFLRVEMLIPPLPRWIAPDLRITVPNQKAGTLSATGLATRFGTLDTYHKPTHPSRIRVTNGSIHDQ